MLQGTIGDQKLDDVFRLLALSEKTGRLQVRRPGSTGEVTFAAGDVCEAHSNAFVEPLGQRLVGTGRISREDVRIALDRQADDKRRMGELLVEMGVIDLDDVLIALENQIIDIAVDLLEWETGEFVWSPLGELHLDLPVAIPVDRIINKFALRADDLEMAKSVAARGDPRLDEAARAGEACVQQADGSGAGPVAAPVAGGGAAVEERALSARLPEETSPEAAAGLFDVVVVCTGNQFRSPIVEGLLRSSAHRLPIRVSSVGTADLGPARALPEAIELASEFGVDLSAHRARALRKIDLSEADLVLGFEGSHVAEAVVEAKAAVARTFTLVELVELLPQIEPPHEDDLVDRAREVVARAHAARPNSGMPRADLQIRDPLGRSPQVYRETAARLRDLSRRLLEGLFGHTPIQPPPPRRVGAR
jgi:protein-tyrosine phosphatase